MTLDNLPQYDISPGKLDIHSLPGKLNIVKLVRLFISNATPEKREIILNSFILSEQPLDDGKRHSVLNVIFSRVLNASPQQLWKESLEVTQEEILEELNQSN